MRDLKTIFGVSLEVLDRFAPGKQKYIQGNKNVTDNKIFWKAVLQL